MSNLCSKRSRDQGESQDRESVASLLDSAHQNPSIAQSGSQGGDLSTDCVPQSSIPVQLGSLVEAIILFPT